MVVMLRARRASRRGSSRATCPGDRDASRRGDDPAVAGARLGRGLVPGLRVGRLRPDRRGVGQPQAIDAGPPVADRRRPGRAAPPAPRPRPTDRDARRRARRARRRRQHDAAARRGSGRSSWSSSRRRRSLLVARRRWLRRRLGAPGPAGDRLPDGRRDGRPPRATRAARRRPSTSTSGACPTRSRRPGRSCSSSARSTVETTYGRRRLPPDRLAALGEAQRRLRFALLRLALPAGPPPIAGGRRPAARLPPTARRCGRARRRRPPRRASPRRPRARAARGARCGSRRAGSSGRCGCRGPRSRSWSG